MGVFMNQEVKKEVIFRVTSIILWTLFLIFTTVFWFLPKREFTRSMAYSMDQSFFYLEELSDGISLLDMYPMSDEVGLKQKSFSFQVVNQLDQEVTYAVSFENDLSKIENPEKLLKSNYLRYQIVRNGEPLPIQNLNLDGTLLVSTVNAHSQDVYELRVWLDKNVGNEAQDKEFYGFVSIHTIFSE